MGSGQKKIQPEEIIAHIVFDIGGVLIKITPEQAKQGIFEFLKINIQSDYSDAQLRQIAEEIFQPWFMEEKTGIELWGQYFDTKTVRKIIDGYRQFHDQRYPFNPEMIRLVKKLQRQGYQPGIISNFSRDLIVWPKPERDELFDPVVYSGMVSVKKPNSKIFEIFFKKANCRPENCVFVDDEEDAIVAARKVGMKAVFYQKPSQLISDLKKIGINLD